MYKVNQIPSGKVLGMDWKTWIPWKEPLEELILKTIVLRDT